MSPYIQMVNGISMPFLMLACVRVRFAGSLSSAASVTSLGSSDTAGESCFTVSGDTRAAAGDADVCSSKATCNGTEGSRSRTSRASSDSAIAGDAFPFCCFFVPVEVDSVARSADTSVQHTLLGISSLITTPDVWVLLHILRPQLSTSGGANFKPWLFLGENKFLKV